MALVALFDDRALHITPHVATSCLRHPNVAVQLFLLLSIVFLERFCLVHHSGSRAAFAKASPLALFCCVVQFCSASTVARGVATYCPFLFTRNRMSRSTPRFTRQDLQVIDFVHSHNRRHKRSTEVVITFRQLLSDVGNRAV